MCIQLDKKVCVTYTQGKAAFPIKIEKKRKTKTVEVCFFIVLAHLISIGNTRENFEQVHRLKHILCKITFVAIELLEIRRRCSQLYHTPWGSILKPSILWHLNQKEINFFWSAILIVLISLNFNYLKSEHEFFCKQSDVRLVKVETSSLRRINFKHWQQKMMFTWLLWILLCSVREKIYWWSKELNGLQIIGNGKIIFSSPERYGIY